MWRDRRLTLWLLAAWVTLLLGAPVARAQSGAGQLDPSFGASLGLRGNVSNIFPQPNGKVLVVGGFQRIVRLNSDGTLDGSFNLASSVTFYSASNIAVQPDGKLLLWNSVQVNGVSKSLVRLKTDGTLDTTLVSPTVSYLNGGTATIASIAALVVQSTGKIVISGYFNRVNGQSAPTGMARLTTTGGFDATFQPAATSSSSNAGSGTAQPGNVTQLALLSNDGILIGGFFQSVDSGNGTFTYYTNTGPVAQLGANGAFAGSPYQLGGSTPGMSNNYILSCFGTHPDGRIAVAISNSSGSPLTPNMIYVFNGSATNAYQYGSGMVSKVLPTSDGKVLVAGYIMLNDGTYTSRGLIRLKADNTLDASFNPLTNDTYTGVQTPSGLFETSSQIYLGGVVNVDNQPCNGLARINFDGSLDGAFRADVAPGTNDDIGYVLAQPDGKVLINGTFSQFNGAPQLHFARLNTDGTLDTTYVPGVQLAAVPTGFCLQADGKLLVNSAHDLLDDLVVYGLTRLNVSDGSIDGSFTPNLSGGTVAGEAVQPSDGKILVWGSFTAADGAVCNGFTRLTAAGRLDAAFNGSVSVTGTVYSAIVQANGQIFLRGNFTKVDGVSRTSLARLNADGTLDQTFPDGVSIRNGTYTGTVYDATVQTDGKIVLVGNFTTVQGVARKGVARLKTNGTLDPNLDPQANGIVTNVYLQPDGKLLVLGSYNNIYGVARSQFARLNPGDDATPGSLDTLYNPLASPGAPSSVAFLPNGRVVVAGSFNQVNGLVRNYVARLNADGSTDHTFNPGVGTPRVLALAVQPGAGTNDPVAERVIVGGAFTAAGGYPAYGIAWLRSDGTDDTAYHSPFLPGDSVQALQRQPRDGAVVVSNLTTGPTGGGSNARLIAAEVAAAACSGDARRIQAVRARATAFARSSSAERAGGQWTRSSTGPRVDSKVKNPIVRCQALTGSLDTDFSPQAGTNGTALSLGVQTDGKIVVGGVFTQLNAAAGHTNLGRLMPDGTLDNTFNATVGGAANVAVQAVLAAPDGTIYAGGFFTQVNGLNRASLARLTNSGALDPNYSAAAGTDGPVLALKLQRDGQLVIGGTFATAGGVAHSSVARFHADGTPDPGFNAGAVVLSGGTAQVTSIDQQTDGKLIITGLFDHVGGYARNNVARLYADGTVDPSYAPGAGPDAIVHAVALQADGKALLGGDFVTVDNAERSAAARLLGDYDLSQYPPLGQWRILNFGGPDATGNATDAAMPYGDGVSNLMKYALNLNARAADATAMTANGTKGLPLLGKDATGQYLTLTFVRRQAATAPGVNYLVEFANSLPNPTSFAINPAAASTVTTLDTTWERVTVTDSVPVSAQQLTRFVRVRITDP